MKTNFRIVALFFLLLISASAHAQHPVERYKALNVGDTVPDIELNTVNSKSSSVHISDFRGKLLILDFWSIYCSPCIALLPEMEKLQQEFKNNVVILPVISMQIKKELINKFFESRKEGGKVINLPSAVEAFVLDTLFPHNGVPTEVWIDKDGKVLSTATDQYSVTKDNIKKVLEGSKVTFQSTYYSGGYNRYLPILVNNNGGPDSGFSYRSIITPYNPFINGVNLTQYSGPQTIMIRATNESVISLFKAAITHNGNQPNGPFSNDLLNKRVLLEPKDNFPYKDNSEKDLFCYEIMLPGSFSYQAGYDMMLQDLMRFFRIKASVEKRRIKCLALVRTSEKSLVRVSEKKMREISSDDHLYFKIENCHLSRLIDYLNNFWGIPLVVDETNYKGKADIEIQTSNLTDLPLLNSILRKNGLKLVPTYQSLDMLVLSAWKNS